MSIGKLSDAGRMGAEFEGMTLPDFLEFIKSQFYKAYGRYENASGKMFVEIEHNGADDNHDIGSVKWRKGIVKDSGELELLEDEVIERMEALPRYSQIVHKGYSRVFQAVTNADFLRETEKQAQGQSALKREGLLGSYYKGKEFFRLSEFKKDYYSAERGYDGSLTNGTHDLTEQEARDQLETALADGFRREGEELETASTFSFDAWGITEPTTIEPDPQPPEGAFNIGGFAAMFDDEKGS